MAASFVKRGAAMNCKDEVEQIIQSEAESPVYQPIFSLQEGNILGFYGEVKFPGRNWMDQIAFLELAQEWNWGEEAQVLCHKAILRGAAGRIETKKLFLWSQQWSAWSNRERGKTTQSVTRFLLQEAQIIWQVSLQTAEQICHHPLDWNCLCIILRDTEDLAQFQEHSAQWDVRWIGLESHCLKESLRDPSKQHTMAQFCKTMKEKGVSVLAGDLKSESYLEEAIRMNIDFGYGNCLEKANGRPALSAETGTFLKQFRKKVLQVI